MTWNNIKDDGHAYRGDPSHIADPCHLVGRDLRGCPKTRLRPAKGTGAPYVDAAVDVRGRGSSRI